MGYKKYFKHKLMIYAIGLIFIVLCFAMQAFNNHVAQYEPAYGHYTSASIDKIMQYDDGTISKPQTIYNTMKDDLTSYEYEVSSAFDVYYLKDSFTSDVYINGEKDNQSYTVYLNYDQGECMQNELSFSGRYSGELGQSLQYLNKDEFDHFASILGFENVCNEFINHYSKLKQHSENKGIQNCTIELDDYIIYIKENHGEDYNTTLYEYRVYNK